MPPRSLQAYLDKFSHINQQERQYYAAMVNLLDDNVGRVVNMLQDAGLWNDTLLVASSDNGGPVGDGYGGNNWPLKGGKASNWEGGVRANAFVAGGAVPPARRGRWRRRRACAGLRSGELQLACRVPDRLRTGISHVSGGG